jgi:hypothetical protein
MKLSKNVILAGMGLLCTGVGYYIGKYRRIGKATSYTLAGVAMLLYIPKGIDIIDKQLERESNNNKIELMYQIRNDSIDAIIKLEESRAKIHNYSSGTRNKHNESRNNQKYLEGESYERGK